MSLALLLIAGMVAPDCVSNGASVDWYAHELPGKTGLRICSPGTSDETRTRFENGLAVWTIYKDGSKETCVAGKGAKVRTCTTRTKKSSVKSVMQLEDGYVAHTTFFDDAGRVQEMIGCADTRHGPVPGPGYFTLGCN